MTEPRQNSDSWRDKIFELRERQSTTKSDLDNLCEEVRAAGAGDASKLAEFAQRRERLTVTAEALEGDILRAQAGLSEALRAEEQQRIRDLHERSDAAAETRAEAAAGVDKAATDLASAVARYYGAAGRHHQLRVALQGGVEGNTIQTQPLGAGAIAAALWVAGIHQLPIKSSKPASFADSDATRR